MQELIAKMRINMNNNANSNAINYNNNNNNNIITNLPQIQPQNLTSFGKNTFTIASSSYSLVNRALNSTNPYQYTINDLQANRNAAPSYRNSNLNNFQNASNSTPI